MTCDCDCACCGDAEPTLPPFEGPEEPGGFTAAMHRYTAKANAEVGRIFDAAVLYGVPAKTG